MAVIVTVQERGGPSFTHHQEVELDLEGRIPPAAQVELGRAVEEFITSEWIERISRTF